MHFNGDLRLLVKYGWCNQTVII